MTKKKFRIAAFSLCLVFIISATAYYELRDNLHTVIPNQVYRSAQLNAPHLVSFVKQKHIKSIINLRGVWESNLWYRDEIAISKQLDVAHYDLRLPTHELPDKASLVKLVTLLDTVPKPILVHCKSGADRTGLASAIALILNGSTDKAAIEKAYSWHYYAISSDSIGKLVIPNYLRWLKKNKLNSSRVRFLTWLKQFKPEQAQHS